MTHKPLIVSIVSILAPMALLAEETTVLAPVTVEGEHVPEPSISHEETEDIIDTSADGGEFLRNIPGVSGGRMGGHGIEPIIRGQSQNQLNILLDGAYVHGGCPNRMDPPTAYSPVETYDSVTVLKGSQTVVYGGGGSGGTVLFERKTPRLSQDKHIRGQFGGGYMSNSETKELFGDVTVGGALGFARGIIEYKDANNYEDGDGKQVRSAYSSQTGSLIFGYTPNEKTRLELNVEANRTDDALYAGATMDSPKSDNDTIRLKYKDKWGIKAELYYSEVDHVMDNYSLRPASMKMLAPSKSKTQGGRFSYSGHTGSHLEWTLGIDSQHNNRDANRYGGATRMLQSIMWPDVDLTQTGVFGEMEMPIGEMDLFKMGLRYDRVTSEAARANQTTTMGTPNALYSKYYGKTAEEVDENNVGGFLRYEKGFSKGFTFFSLSRSVRTADATERYLASNNSTTKKRWIGNPDLAPEQHHQVEIGFSLQPGDWHLNTSAYYNQVTDYILRDRAHAQSGILQNDNASIYRNVDAQLYGLEWEIQGEWDKRKTGSLAVAYVHATNTSDDRPIAQTPPLNVTTTMDYKYANAHLGGNLRVFAQQTRVDDNPNTGSGLDAQQTHGFAVLDLYSAIEFHKLFTLRFGVNNVFNRTYAYHVNRANFDPFNPDAIQVNEPGRAWWLNFLAKF